MNEPINTEDELLLIDYVLRRCEPGRAGHVRLRLQQDAAFRNVHENLTRTLAALGLCQDVTPSEDLADRTVRLVHEHRRRQGRPAGQELVGRGTLRPMFSLRELVAVAAAVVLMGAILVPSVRYARERSLQNHCGAQMGQIGFGLHTYAGDNDGALPTVGAVSGWLPGAGEHPVSNSAALFQLAKEGYVAPMTFQCPAVGAGTFVVRPDMTDFPHAGYISYSYQHSLAGGGPSRIRTAQAAAANRMAILADASPLFRNGRFLPRCPPDSNSRNHRGLGQNVLYLSMAVQWTEHPSAGVADNNIFVAEGVRDYDGDEEPAGPTDSFLLPAHWRDPPPNERPGQPG